MKSIAELRAERDKAVIAWEAASKVLSKVDIEWAEARVAWNETRTALANWTPLWPRNTIAHGRNMKTLDELRDEWAEARHAWVKADAALADADAALAAADLVKANQGIHEND